LVELLLQIQMRLPEIIEIIEGLSALHPNKVVSQPAPLPFSQLPLSFLKGRHMCEVEEQCRKLCFVDWANGIFSESIPPDATKFWIGLRRYKNAAGESAF